MRTLLLVVVLAGCAPPSTATVVTIEERPAVREIEILEVTFSNDNTSLSESFDIAGREFPLTFTLETGERTGDVTMTARGIDEAGELVAIGSTVSTIVPDELAEATLLLDPADFSINTGFAGSQKLAWNEVQAGGQLAAGPDGTFTVGFTDDCGGLGRCDLFARRFDVASTPVRTDAAASDAQFIVNVTPVFGNDPALAVAPDGTMLAAWSTLDDLLAIAITPTGAPKNTAETQLSTGLSADDPAVAALPDGTFLVVWTETDETPSQRHLRGRLLDGNGAPIVNPETGTVDAFTIDDGGSPDAPAVAVTGNGFEAAILWQDGADLKVRFLDNTGGLLPAVTVVSGANGEQIWSPRIVALEAGSFVLAWGDTVDSGPRRLVARRIAAPTGAIVGTDAFLAADLPDTITRFGLAEGDGELVATWHACGDDVDGSNCGIRARVFRPTGLPVGEPLLVNTTTRNAQLAPSVTWLGAASTDHGASAFAIAWTDESGAVPDDSETQIRGRIVYPPFATAAGILGADCGGTGATPCGEGLVCMAGTDDVTRCHRACDPAGPDPDCPEGGICTTAGDVSGCKL